MRLGVQDSLKTWENQALLTKRSILGCPWDYRGRGSSKTPDNHAHSASLEGELLMGRGVWESTDSLLMRSRGGRIYRNRMLLTESSHFGTHLFIQFDGWGLKMRVPEFFTREKWTTQNLGLTLEHNDAENHMGMGIFLKSIWYTRTAKRQIKNLMIYREYPEFSAHVEQH